MVHPFVIGELACGNLRDRSTVLGLLAGLPLPVVADHAEVLGLVESRELYGRGIGWIDMHLLASALLTNVGLWSHDRRLASVAGDLGLA